MTGVPFLECQQCGKRFDRSNVAMEWDLMTPGFQIKVKAACFLRKLLIGGFWILFALYCVAASMNEGGFDELNHFVMIALWCVIAIPTAFYFYQADIEGQIARSRDRLSDTEYRAKLTHFGYIPKDDSQ